MPRGSLATGVATLALSLSFPAIASEPALSGRSFCGVVVSPPQQSEVYPVMHLDRWVGNALVREHIYMDRAFIAWSLDPTQQLPFHRLSSGTKVRVIVDGYDGSEGEGAGWFDDLGEKRKGGREFHRGAGPGWFAARVEILTLGSYGFDLVVEEFVVDASRRPLEDALAPAEIAAIHALAAPCWQLREAATTALRTQGIEALRALAWAKSSPDLEIKTRAEGLLEALGWER